MKGLSVPEANSLLRCTTLDEWVEALRDSLALYKQAFHVEPPASRRTALARFLGENLFCHSSSCWVYITEAGIFPSSEHRDIFDTFRRGAGESRLLDDAPVQEFDIGEHDRLISIISLILYFSWDAEVVAMDGETLVTISHNNWIEIRSGDQASIEESVARQRGVLTAL